MSKRERIALIERQPSVVALVKHGRRETEATLLEGDGVSAMINTDGGIVIEVYTGSKSIRLRLAPDDVKAQSHIFKHWRDLR